MERVVGNDYTLSFVFSVGTLIIYRIQIFVNMPFNVILM
nr:MAG TPA: hypothetical protein [Caudoviricetes sp.]